MAPDALPEQLSGEENVSSDRQEEQAPPLPQKVPPPSSEPVLESQAPHPPSPRLSGVMHTLRVRLFSPPPPYSVEAGNPLSAPPSPEDDDDVLLVPLTEPQPQGATWDADDVPLLA